MTIFSEIKTILITVGIIAAVWFYKDYQYQKSEKERITENYENRLKSDSLKYSKETLTKQEIIDYLDYQRKDLKSYIDQKGIKPKQIEQIISQNLKDKDTTSQTVLIAPIKEGVKFPFTYKNDCLQAFGTSEIVNDSLKTTITGYEYDNQTDVIGYWERKRILGLKIGRKQAKVEVRSKCGESQTFFIEKRK